MQETEPSVNTAAAKSPPRLSMLGNTEAFWSSAFGSELPSSTWVFHPDNTLSPLLCDRLADGELYAGVYIDFMGTDSAIYRTLGKQTAMRTDQYNSRWLNGNVQFCSQSWSVFIMCSSFKCIANVLMLLLMRRYFTFPYVPKLVHRGGTSRSLWNYSLCSSGEKGTKSAANGRSNWKGEI